jgi:hypothetical protein
MDGERGQQRPDRDDGDGLMATPAVRDTYNPSASSASSRTFPITTVQTDYILVLAVYNENAGSAAPTVSSVTSAGFTWALRRRSNTSTTGCMELWWTHGTGALSAYNITVNLSAVCDNLAMVLAVVTGCANPANPFDHNVGLPSAQSAPSMPWTPSFTGVNTSNANDLLLFMSGSVAGGGTQPTGFTRVNTASVGGGSWGAVCMMDALGVTAVQSSATFTLGAALTNPYGSATVGEAIFDALSDAPPTQAQVTQVALEQWGQGTPQAQVTQIALEEWIGQQAQAPYVPPPPPPPGKGGGQDKGKGQGKIKQGPPALRSEGRLDALLPFRHKRPLAPWALIPVTAQALAEQAATTSAITASVIYSAALTASAATADAITSGRILAALLAEGATTSAALSATLRAAAVLAESGHGSDALASTAVHLAHLADGATTSDMPYHGVTAPGMLSEGAATSAAITAFLITHGALTEGSVTTAAVAGFRTLLAALSEAAAGSAALAGTGVRHVSLAEQAAATDALQALAHRLAAVAETVVGQDDLQAVATLRAAIAEATATLDADRWLATTHPLRRAARLIGEQSTPDLEGEWPEPGSNG